MNMISKLRRKFTSHNDIPVDSVRLSGEEFNQLQAEWIKRIVLEGHAIVPLEPTEAMIKAGAVQHELTESLHPFQSIDRIYKAMIANKEV